MATRNFIPANGPAAWLNEQELHQDGTMDIDVDEAHLQDCKPFSTLAPSQGRARASTTSPRDIDDIDVYIHIDVDIDLGGPSAEVGPAPNTPSQCAAASLRCCDTVGTVQDAAVASLLGLLGIPIQNLTGVIGLRCSPILSGSNAGCAAHAVCCTGSSGGGLASTGCVPVALGL